MVFNTKYNRPFPVGESGFPNSKTDQMCLSVAQQIDRFMLSGQLPKASQEYFDSEVGLDTGNVVISPYGLSDPVDIERFKQTVDNRVKNLQEIEKRKKKKISDSENHSEEKNENNDKVDA